MSISENSKFTCTWEIQNFSMCTEKTGKSIKSPEFVVYVLKNSTWCLEIYPKGKETKDTVSFDLTCTGGGDYGEIDISYSFTLVSADTEKNMTREFEGIFDSEESYGETISFTRDDIFKSKDLYLPNDTLTVKCSLWEQFDLDNVQTPSVPKKDIFTKMSGDYLEDFEPCQSFFVQTRIPVVRKTISWPIRRFSFIRLGKEITTGIHSTLTDVPSFFITVYKSRDEYVDIQIRKNKTEYSTFVKCKISVIPLLKSEGFFAEDEYLFKPDSEDFWNFPTFLDLSKLKHKYFLQTNDVLHLRFELAFPPLNNQHLCEELHEIETDFSKSLLESLKNSCHAINEFGQLYRDGARSDVTLRAGDREFKVHKMILKARSPVFSAMFDNDMKEKKTGTVDITDVDSDTVDKMLEFMYTNAVVDVDVESACKLYSAADKYEVLPLKLRCTLVLESTLSASSVCELLNLADLHHDEYLHSYAERFVQDNAKEILKSKNWENLMNTNGTVAAKVMHKIFVNT